MNYRIAVKEDIADLVRLRVQFLKEKQPEKGRVNGEVLVATLEKYFDRHLAAGDMIFWVAEKDAQIVATGGVCFYNLPPSFEVMEEERAYLLNIYAIPCHRDKGVEKKLFGLLLDEADKRKVSSITLHASEKADEEGGHFVLHRK
jgi:GNAT superfamily N-acetyltransferase